MKSILNLWEDYNFNVLNDRVNTESLWNGPDNLETLKKIHKNAAMKTYAPKDFNYKFNSLGFRSAEFNNDDPVKVLYGGCSLTEGIGLPIEHTWSTFVNEQISAKIEKPVSLYNVGMGGFSIDAITRFIYVTIDSGKFIPDVVFLLLPSPLRNEYYLIDRNNQPNLHHFIATYREYTDPEIRVFHDNVMKTYMMTQRVHETFRNLVFLQSYLESKGIPLFFSTWDNYKIMVHPKFGPNLGFAEILKDHAPDRIRNCFIPAYFEYDSFAEQHFKDPRMFVKKFPHNIGRDGMHHGPNSHWNFSREFFNQLMSSKPEFVKLLEKWKTSQP